MPTPGSKLCHEFGRPRRTQLSRLLHLKQSSERHQSPPFERLMDHEERPSGHRFRGVLRKRSVTSRSAQPATHRRPSQSRKNATDNRARSEYRLAPAGKPARLRATRREQMHRKENLARPKRPPIGLSSRGTELWPGIETETEASISERGSSRCPPFAPPGNRSQACLVQRRSSGLSIADLRRLRATVPG